MKTIRKDDINSLFICDSNLSTILNELDNLQTDYYKIFKFIEDNIGKDLYYLKERVVEYDRELTELVQLLKYLYNYDKMSENARIIREHAKFYKSVFQNNDWFEQNIRLISDMPDIYSEFKMCTTDSTFLAHNGICHTTKSEKIINTLRAMTLPGIDYEHTLQNNLSLLDDVYLKMIGQNVKPFNSSEINIITHIWLINRTIYSLLNAYKIVVLEYENAYKRYTCLVTYEENVDYSEYRNKSLFDVNKEFEAFLEAFKMIVIEDKSKINKKLSQIMSTPKDECCVLANEIRKSYLDYQTRINDLLHLLKLVYRSDNMVYPNCIRRMSKRGGFKNIFSNGDWFDKNVNFISKSDYLIPNDDKLDNDIIDEWNYPIMFKRSNNFISLLTDLKLPMIDLKHVNLKQDIFDYVFSVEFKTHTAFKIEYKCKDEDGYTNDDKNTIFYSNTIINSIIEIVRIYMDSIVKKCMDYEFNFDNNKVLRAKVEADSKHDSQWRFKSDNTKKFDANDYKYNRTEYFDNKKGKRVITIEVDKDQDVDITLK